MRDILDTIRKTSLLVLISMGVVGFTGTNCQRKKQNYVTPRQQEEVKEEIEKMRPYLHDSNQKDPNNYRPQ